MLSRPRFLGSLTALTLTALSTITGGVGCGGKTAGTCLGFCPSGDAGPEDSGEDGAVDDAGDAAPDGGPVQLAAVTNALIYGVTDDGLIVYGTLPTQDVLAVPFSGGAPTQIAPPPSAGDAGTYMGGGAFVSHHLVVISMASDQSSAAPGAPILVWDERTGVTTTFAAPPQAFSSASWVTVSPDSNYIAIPWTPVSRQASTWTAARVDGSQSISLGAAYFAVFDEDRLVVSMLTDVATGAPGAPLIALDAKSGWSKVTLATDAAVFAVDGVGTNALIAEGPYPSGGQGIVLAPLDGGAPTVIDPTGGGPMVYLSPDSTFAMYTAAAGTPDAHVEAVTLSASGPLVTPYAVTALPGQAGGAIDAYASAITVLPGAPGGPVAISAGVSTSTTTFAPMTLAGVGAGATAPNLVLPSSPIDGFTRDASRVMINRPSAAAPGTAGTLTAFPLPAGPESAPLSTSSFGWVALAGSTVLFTDNFMGGWAVLRIADVAKGTSSTLVATSTYGIGVYGVSPDRTHLAYTTASGLWVTTLPTDL